MGQDATGTKVNLGPGDVVLDGVATPPAKGAQPPVFGSCPNGWKDEDATWYGSIDLGPDGDPTRSPTRERGAQSPRFSALVYCGHGRQFQLTATLELLFDFCTFGSPGIAVLLADKQWRR